MSSLNRLSAKLEDLEEEENDIRKKLKFLRKEILVKTDSEAKYELRQRIDESEARLEEIDEEIELLENKISRFEQSENTDSYQTFDCLYKSLLKLGYWEQHLLFQEVSEKHSHGAFLIQGYSKDYGQRWLLKRLASSIPNVLNGKKIIVDLKRTSSKTDILAIWHDFARRAGLSEKASPTEITHQICELKKSQNVLVVFDNVDETAKENLCDLLNIFWKSLTQTLSHSQSQQSDFKLLIFFLDYQGVVTPWNAGFAERFDSQWQPESPLGLPNINSFSDRDLREWLNYESDSLPSALSTNKTEAVQTLLKEQGIPIFTLARICSLCGCSWFDQEGQWLSL
ncbi:MAG: hypothetical protein WA885_17530 [Phormidesmis sp.]